MPPVQFDLLDGVAKISIDDGKANAINGVWLSGLDHAIDRAEAARAAVVLTGRPGFFSGGLDLKTLPKLPAADLQQVLSQFAAVMLRLFTYRRPVIAASSGHAIAGGMVLMLAADERIAAEGPFRLGLNESAIGLSLPRFVVEMARAQLPAASLARVIAHGELFSPADAHEVGLVDALAAPEAVLERAMARAKLLAAIPEAAYADNKLSLRGEHAERGRTAFTSELSRFVGFFNQPKEH